jgi:tRNA(fMet)-specific endonuclease VapC
VAGRAGHAARHGVARGAELDRLILATTILIAGERGQARLDDLIGDKDDVVIAAITVAELLVGVELADEANRSRRRALVDSVVAAVPVEDYDLEVARSHAQLLAHTRRSGRPRGAHDLVIAATALARNRVVVTADRDGFTDLPGVSVRLVPGSVGKD